MLEMSDAEYQRSSLLGLVWFVLRVPFARALRRRTPTAWIAAIPVAVLYEAFAVPLVVGSVVVLLILMAPMLVIAAAARLVQSQGSTSDAPIIDDHPDPHGRDRSAQLDGRQDPT